MSATTTDDAREVLARAMSLPQSSPVSGPEEQYARDLVERSLAGVTEQELRTAINTALLSSDSTGPERLMLMRKDHMPTATMGLICYRARLVLPRLIKQWDHQARLAELRHRLFGNGTTTARQPAALVPVTVQVVEVDVTLTALEAEALRVQLMTLLADGHMLHKMWTSMRATKHESFIPVLKTPLPATASPWQIDTLHRALRIAGRKFIVMRESMAAA